MSGVALGVPVASPRPRSYWRLLWGVALGSFLSSVILLVVGWLLSSRDWIPQQNLYPAPFLVDGAWSLGADLVVAATIVLVWAWMVHLQVKLAVGESVSFGVVVLAVAVVGYLPFVVLGPKAFLGLFLLPVIAWIVRRYAIGTALPGPSWPVWLGVGVLGVAVFGSYVVYHPLRPVDGSGWPSFGHQLRHLTIKNSGAADLTITKVGGGMVGDPDSWPSRLKLPHTVRPGGTVGLWVHGLVCVPRDVNLTLSVLGLTTTQRILVKPDWVTAGLHYGDAPAC